MNWHTLIMLGGMLPLTACGNDANGTATGSCNEPMSVVVSVDTSGSQPTFDCSADCRVTSVLVELKFANQWHVGDSQDGNGIAPPVDYGVVPPGASSRSGPIDLVPGLTYDVSLRRVHPDRPNQDLLATGTFTR